MLTSLFIALHRSRRVGAKRVTRRYRHLIAKECDFKAQAMFPAHAKGDFEMAMTDSSHARRPSSLLKAWTIAVLAGLGVLHLVGGYMLHHASSIRPVETAAVAIQGD